MRKKLTGLLIVCFLLCTVCECSALTFNPFKRSGRVKNANLFLVGNIVPARLLADLAQWYTKQPILLLSPDADGVMQIYYAPSDSRATVVNPEQFMEMVDFINPNRVIVLGGEEVVERKYIDMIGEKYKVLVLDSTNWSNNASALGDLLEVDRLRPQFDHYMGTLNKLSEQQRRATIK